jgi:hypothetical protein
MSTGSVTQVIERFACITMHTEATQISFVADACSELAHIRCVNILKHWKVQDAILLRSEAK